MADCTHCGNEIRPGDKFCQYCGQQVRMESDEQPAYVGASSTPLQAPHSYSSPQSQPAASGSAPRGGTGPLGAVQEGKARLVVRVSPTAEPGAVVDDGEREFVLDGRDVAIGRAPSCDIVLAGDQLASRRHALLRYKGGQYSVVDLGSSNGTYVNDQEIHGETELQDGDRITIGGHDMVFSTAAASPAASLPGVALAPAEPAAPLLETAPSLSAVNLPSPLNGHDANAAPAETTAETTADEAQVSEAEPVATADAFIVASPPGTPEADLANSASNQEDIAAVETQDIAAVAAEAQDHAQEDAQGRVEPLTVPASDDAELDALRAQLAEISTALARKADEEYRLAGRLRAALVEVRDQLSNLLREHGAGSYDTVPEPARDYGELVALARQAAESPLDHLTTLVRHAGEIADALESAQTAQGGGGNTGDLLASLEALRARLDETLG